MPRSSGARPDTSSSISTMKSRVVGVGLVELEHGELGVVAGRQALVAEDPADLEDLLEAAHHQPLQVQLGRDAQVEVGVEGVVVGDERLGRAPRRGWRGASASPPRRTRRASSRRRSELTSRLRSRRTSPARSLAHRSTSRWRKRVSVSVTPFHLSPKDRAGLGQQHPRRGPAPTARPCGSARPRPWRPPSRRATAWRRPRSRRSPSPGRRAGSGPTSRAAWRRPAAPAGASSITRPATGHLVLGLLAGAERGVALVQRPGLGRAVER